MEFDQFPHTENYLSKFDDGERLAQDYLEGFKLLESTNGPRLAACTEHSLPVVQELREAYGLHLLGLAELPNGELRLLQPARGLESCSGRVPQPQGLFPPGLEEPPKTPMLLLSAGTSAGSMTQWRQSVGTH